MGGSRGREGKVEWWHYMIISKIKAIVTNVNKKTPQITIIIDSAKLRAFQLRLGTSKDTPCDIIFQHCMQYP